MISIQPDFSSVISDVIDGSVPAESIWLTIDGQSYSINITANTSAFSSNDPKISLSVSSTHKYILHLKDRRIILRTPTSYLSSKTFNCFDVDSRGRLVVAGDDSGKITCYKHEHSSLDITLTIPEAHLSDVLQILIFPSGKVALSMGLDYQIKIYSLTDGSNPRTMKGVQLQRLTAIALIGDHGRNFVSGSRDGTACIWECGSGKCIQKFQRVKDIHDGVMSLSIGEGGAAGAVGVQGDTNSLFFECSGKQLCLGHESGTISIWDLGNRSFIGEIEVVRNEGAVSSLAVSKNLVIAGYGKRCMVRCYEFGVKNGELNWEVKWEVKGSEEEEIKKLEIKGELVLCLSSDGLVSRRVEDGEIKECYVGYEGIINDVSWKESVWVCGKGGVAVF